MKNFLFIVSFISVSNLLFSKPLFEKMFYESCMNCFFEGDLLKEDATVKNNLLFLKQITQKYLELLECLDYEDALEKTEREVWKNDLGGHFGLNTKQIVYLLDLLKTNMKHWIWQSERAFRHIFMFVDEGDEYNKKIEEIAIPTDADGIKAVLKTMSPDEVLQIHESEEAMAFAEAVLKFCKLGLEIVTSNEEEKSSLQLRRQGIIFGGVVGGLSGVMVGSPRASSWALWTLLGAKAGVFLVEKWQNWLKKK